MQASPKNAPAFLVGELDEEAWSRKRRRETAGPLPHPVRQAKPADAGLGADLPSPSHEGEGGNPPAFASADGAVNWSTRSSQCAVSIIFPKSIPVSMPPRSSM